jgi:H+/Cl- antiporter ClcA
MPLRPLHQLRQLQASLGLLAQLLLLGAVVGLACWPLNAIDHLQDQLLGLLPGWSGESWRGPGLLLACAPLAVMPLLLVLQAGPLRDAAGSGIPQTMESLEHPELAPRLLDQRTTLARLLNWTLASLALMPLGREGPLVQLGSAVARGLQRRCPWLLPHLSRSNLVAIGAGAGLAGGFNSPLMGAVFVMEELLGRYSASLLWPTALTCAAAALVSNLAGLPLYSLGQLSTLEPEWQQLAWGLVIGGGAGILGGLMSRLLLQASNSLSQRIRQAPLRWGLALGAALSLMALLSGGRSGGDGEALLTLLIHGNSQAGLELAGSAHLDADLGWIALLVSRLVGPALALGAGIPGGLIDPAFGLGGLLATGLMQLLGGNPELGLALGMAGGLAGATQLPLMTVLFAMRMTGDLQWLLGLVVSAVIGAYMGRRVQSQPIYHALWKARQQAANGES